MEQQYTHTHKYTDTFTHREWERGERVGGGARRTLQLLLCVLINLLLLLLLLPICMARSYGALIN